MRETKDKEVPPRERKPNNRKGNAALVTVASWMIIAVVIIGGLIWAVPKFFPSAGEKLSIAGNGGTSQVIAVAPNINTQCSQNPAYTYTGIDAFTSSAVPGTAQIKNGQDAPVSSLAAPTAGAALQFWNSNATTFCEVKSGNAACGSNTMQTKCYQNGTVTLGLRDIDNDVSVSNSATAGTTNVTMGANAVRNLEVRYQASAKQSVMPFGGCVAVEVPTSITDVAISGSGIDTTKACPYPWTYTVSATTNTYRLFAVPAGFDKDGVGDLKRISLQLKSGSSNPAAAAYITFQPANYYVTNDGSFALGIEKDKNADTTKTMAGGAQFAYHID